MERVVPNALSDAAVAKYNRAHQKLRAAIDPFIAALQEGLKHLDRVVRAHEKTLAAEAADEGSMTKASATP